MSELSPACETLQPNIAVALVHSPVLNRRGEASTTAITSIDIHDFARTCGFYHVGPVYLVHPAEGMHALIHDITDYYKTGPGGDRNPGRKEVLKAVRTAFSLEDVQAEGDYQLWYTSASAHEGCMIDASKLSEIKGNHLIVLGTGWGLDIEHLPEPNGWLSPIAGIGMVRHLSVRAALAIYLDRLTR